MMPSSAASSELRQGVSAMQNNKPAEAIATIVATAIHDFREGMDQSQQMSIRIGRGTTQIIRFGLFSVLSLAAAIFYLVYILAADFGRISTSIDTIAARVEGMEQHFAAVSTRRDSQVHKLACPMGFFHL